MSDSREPVRNLEVSSTVAENIIHIPSIKDFLATTSIESRQAMRAALSETLSFFLKRGQPVYLDNLGVLFERVSTRQACRNLGRKALLRSETHSSIRFEKCDDPGTLDQDTFPGLIQGQELTRAVFARLPIELQARWTIRSFGSLLRRLIRLIREEAILEGVSYQLGEIGELYAFHNFRGDTLHDWFAAADMHLDAPVPETLAVSDGQLFSRPVLDNAFEPLEAAFGKPLKVFHVDLGKELMELGYDREEFERSCPEDAKTLKVGVFLVDKASRGERLIYCSEGLRHLAKDSSVIASELTFQLALRDVKAFNEVLDPAEVPVWPARIFTIGWIMMQSHVSKSLKPRLTFTADTTIATTQAGECRNLVTTEFELIRSTQLWEKGEFRYINLLGISQQDLQHLGSAQSSLLHVLLEYRRIDQVTRTKRSAINSSLMQSPSLRKSSLRASDLELGTPSNSETGAELRLVTN